MANYFFYLKNQYSIEKEVAIISGKQDHIKQIPSIDKYTDWPFSSTSRLDMNLKCIQLMKL